MANPIFSIIIPVYKVEDYLKQCVDSMLAQTYQDFELILVDDGSPDRCPEMCDEYAAADSRVVVIHKPNGGLSDSRNAGIQKATGDYLIFVDSDDYWEGDHHLAKLAAILKTDPQIDTVILNNKLYYENTDTFFAKPVVTGDVVPDPGQTLINLIRNYRQGSSAWLRVVRRQLILDHEIYFEKGLLGEDSDWFIHLSLHAKKYHQYDEHVYVYRQNRKGSITATIKLKNITDQFHIIDKWQSRLSDALIDDRTRTALKGFLAYLLSIVVYLVSKLPDGEREQMIAEIEKRRTLFNYALNPKSRQTALMCRLLGIKTTSRLLRTLYLRRMKKRSNS